MKKQLITVYVDSEEYKKFKIQSVVKGKSISQRINDFIKKEVRENANSNESDEV